MLELCLDEPITRGLGVGDIRLGSHISDLMPAIEAAGPWSIKTRASFPRSFVYEYQESLRLHVDLVTGTLFRIEALGDYEGTFAGKIGVGSTVRDLQAVCPELIVEDGLITSPSGDIAFELEDEVDSLEKALSAPIVCIMLELNGYMED